MTVGDVRHSEIRPWWNESPDERGECRACGRYDPMAMLGRFQLCTECRLAADRCTSCGERALHGEWWCPDCKISLREYL